MPVPTQSKAGAQAKTTPNRTKASSKQPTQKTLKSLTADDDDDDLPAMDVPGANLMGAPRVGFGPRAPMGPGSGFAGHPMMGFNGPRMGPPRPMMGYGMMRPGGPMRMGGPMGPNIYQF